MRWTGEPQTGHGFPKRPWTAIAGWNAVTFSGKPLPASPRLGERVAVGDEHVDAAPVVRFEPGLAGDQVQGGALDRAGLGQQQRAGREVERREPELLRNRRAAVPPPQPPGDHEVHDKEQVPRQREDNPFAEAPHAPHRRPVRGVERRRDGAEDEGAQQPDPRQLAPGDARFQARHVDLDVRQLRHGASV